MLANGPTSAVTPKQGIPIGGQSLDLSVRVQAGVKSKSGGGQRQRLFSDSSLGGTALLREGLLLLNPLDAALRIDGVLVAVGSLGCKPVQLYGTGPFSLAFQETRCFQQGFRIGHAPRLLWPVSGPSHAPQRGQRPAPNGHPDGVVSAGGAGLTSPVKHNKLPITDAVLRTARRPARPEKTPRLLADFETPNDVEVTLRINSLEIVQQAPPATDQHQQTSPTGEVLLVRPKVLGQPVDPGRENGDLDLGRAGIFVAPPKLPNQLLLPLISVRTLLE